MTIPFIFFVFSFVSSRFLSVRLSDCHCQPNSVNSFIHFYILWLLSRCCNLQHRICSTRNLAKNWKFVDLHWDCDAIIIDEHCVFSPSFATSIPILVLLMHLFSHFAAHVLFMRERACFSSSLCVCLCCVHKRTLFQSSNLIQAKSSNSFQFTLTALLNCNSGKVWISEIHRHAMCFSEFACALVFGECWRMKVLVPSFCSVKSRNVHTFVDSYFVPFFLFETIAHWKSILLRWKSQRTNEWKKNPVGNDDLVEQNHRIMDAVLFN